MPARPMWRSVHKKVNPWGKGYQPEFSRGKIRGDDKGNVPVGKKKKKDRVKCQPAGYPQGVHVKEPGPKAIMDACFCGHCYIENQGAINLKHG